MLILTDSYGNIPEEVLHQSAPSGARHICREFSQKMGGVIRPSAFRLDRLARGPRRDLGSGNFCREFSEFLEFRFLCIFAFLQLSGVIDAWRRRRGSFHRAQGIAINLAVGPSVPAMVLDIEQYLLFLNVFELASNLGATWVF